MQRQRVNIPLDSTDCRIDAEEPRRSECAKRKSRLSHLPRGRSFSWIFRYGRGINLRDSRDYSFRVKRLLSGRIIKRIRENYRQAVTADSNEFVWYRLRDDRELVKNHHRIIIRKRRDAIYLQARMQNCEISTPSASVMVTWRSIASCQTRIIDWCFPLLVLFRKTAEFQNYGTPSAMAKQCWRWSWSKR